MVVVFFRASVSVGSQECEGNVRRLIGRFFLFRVFVSFLSVFAQIFGYASHIRRRLRRVRGMFANVFFVLCDSHCIRYTFVSREREREGEESLFLSNNNARICVI